MAAVKASVVVDRFRASVPERIGRAKRWLAYEIAQRCIDTTPVDTGYARACWRIALGHADTSVPQKTARPQRTARGAFTPHGAFSGAGPEIPPPVLASITRVPPGVPLVVSNNAPYIVPLNHGHSKQAPTGFVERAVQQSLTGLETAVAELKAQYDVVSI